VLGFLQVLSQSGKDLSALRVAEFLLEFLKREMDHIMVMKLLRCNLVTQLEPDTVEEINFLGRQVRRMRSQIKHMFLPVWEINLKDQLRFGGG
jgi:hypothetical protein